MPAAHPPLLLKDPTLLRQQCYIDGGWFDADGGRTLDVVNRRPAARSAPCR
jgi:hypothetical protein